ncbi:type I polyketide synthase [Streptomyces genisteinicus]|uniref:SDR family NAD(P)-dependent oxidoreductase n=1 Tax=Streptomyces genisteinicus TaxID=2768068 RepID=A0A7H0I537_9ACTN|nr:type I polyketide synthase [Streptomyces genisteinicus]QNP67903.1 SDR family NAD(P)-dependent oxidoreductase [Streptomyces genisteinicus]
MGVYATESAAADLAEFLRAAVAELLGTPADAVDVSVALRDLGVDSSGVTRLAGLVSERLGRTVPAWLLWQHPTVAELASALAGGPATGGSGAAGRSPSAVAADEPIALVGLGCRLPGGIETPQALWEALLAGRDAVTEVPADRWNADEWFDDDPRTPGTMSTRRGGFLDDVAGFDAAFFGISPAEAARMDPQQRIALEVAWAALEDARIVPGTLAGSRAGVFLGTMWQEYHLATGAGPETIGSHSAVGWDTSIVPARIAYALGLEGPAFSVGSACSSSLAAVHMAAHSLRRGESDLALAGGVSLMLSPHTTVAMTKFGGMSPAGQCRAFDADAAGYVRGEGCGVVVLRRLSDALRDGDRVYAVLRGSAVNNDGASNGLTAPNPRAQVDVVRSAWRSAGVAPHQVAYVEAHGTGTPLGDPIEAAALGEVFAPHRTTPLLLGSAKTNFGHLEPAAGVLGVLKTALALHHGRLPAGLHFERPNPLIDFTGLSLEVVTAARDWPEGPRHAGVSGFGFGGTNVHLALTEAPHRQALTAPATTQERQGRAPAVAFCFSGHGSQWTGMGRDLLAEPVFRAEFAEADRAVAAVTGWSVLDALVAPDGRLERTDVLQPVLFALQVALARTLRRWGVVPDAVFGQSVGEVAAAVVAGALTLDEGAHVIGVWSRLVAERAAGTGSMLVCDLTPERAAGLARGRVTLAGRLAPEQVCLSGATAALDEVERELGDAGVRTYRVHIDYPSHSAELAPLAAELVARLGALRPQAAAVPFLSTVTGDWAVGTELDAAYWARNMCRPMLLDEAVRRLPRPPGGGLRVVEISPHPVVSRPVRDTLSAAADDADDAAGEARVLAACRRDRPASQTLQELLHALWCDGVGVDWAEATGTAQGAARPWPWVLSAKTPEALRAQAAALHDYVGSRPGALPADVGHSLATTRSAFGHRAVVVADDREGFLRGLAALAAGRTAPGLVTGDGDDTAGTGRGPVLVFPGQGAQWAGMARELLVHSPVFADAYAACARALGEFVDFSPAEALADEDALRRVDVVQPVLWAVMVSLAELWRAHGVRPAVVVGHSQGEIAAACAAGGLSLEDGARVVALRSQAIARSLAGRGGMVSVSLPRAEVETRLAHWGGRLSVAVVNGPGLTVVSGEPGALDELLEGCEADGVRARRIPVDYASHSAQVDTLREELLTALAPVRPRSTGTLFFSTVTGDFLDTAELDAEYWFRNLRTTVEFESAVAALAGHGHRLFVEASPHPVLCLAVEETAGGAGAVALGTLRRGTDSTARFLESAAEAWVRGAGVAWEASFAARGPAGPRTVDLPPYAFRRRRHWLDPVGQPPAAAPAAGADDAEFWSAVDRGDLAALTASLDVGPEAGLGDLLPALSAWRRRGREAAEVRDWRYEIVWKPVPDPAGPPPAAPWLALLPAGEARAAEVLRALTDAGAGLVPVVLGDEDRELTAKALRTACEDQAARTGGRFAGVLSLLALASGSDPRHDPVPAGYTATLRAVQALGDAEVGAPLWCVTREAVLAGPGDRRVDPAQRMVWGLGRVAALEHSDRWGGLIDLPGAPDAGVWRRVAALLGGDGAEDQVAVRAGGVRARRLVRAGEPPRSAWRPSGTVLVTGGTGALGRRVARRLAEQGAGRLVLTSRRGPGAPDAEAFAAELRGLGAEVVLEACDVSDREQLRAVLDRAAAGGPLTAVVHTAAVLDDATVDALDPGQVERVWRVKAQGAWNLHELTRDRDLSAFVLFSSYGATVGIPGQGNYAPANAFLDALAELRHLEGLPATCVSWGAWGGGGLARGTVRGVLDRHGVPEMDPGLALIALQQALDGGRPCQTVADVRWPRFLTAFTAARPSPLLSELPEVVELARAGSAPAAAADAQQPGGPDLRRRLEELPPGQRTDAVLDVVRTHTAAVLGYGPEEPLEDRRSFKELGFDSVTGVELRNRLNAVTGLRLAATLVFEHPTPAAVAGHVLAELGVGAGDGAERALDVGSLLATVTALDATALAPADADGLAALSRALLELLGDAGAAPAPAAGPHEAQQALDDASDDELFQLIDEKFGL